MRLTTLRAEWSAPRGVWSPRGFRGSMLPLAFALVAAVHEAGAQSRLRFALAPGPHGVGFRAVDLWDNTRALDQPYAATPSLAAAEWGRPLPVMIWYPAVQQSGAVPMRFREYTQLTSLPGQLPKHDSAGRVAAERLFLRLFGGTDSVAVERELNAPTVAVRDARPAHGAFPILIYGPSRDGVSFENGPLLEYLASHGYIVLASPSWGAAGPMTPDFAGIETQARDMEYLLAYARRLPNVDGTRAAVLGDSWGGMSNVLVALRSSSVAALVCLDGSIAYWYQRVLKGGPFVDPDHFTVPALFLKQKDPFPALSPAVKAAYGADTLFTFFNALRYSDAYLVTFETMGHQNFKALHDKLPAAKPTPASVRGDSVTSAAYERVARYTLAFLDAYLKSAPLAGSLLVRTPTEAGIPSGEVTIVRRVGLRPHRTLGDFSQRAGSRGLARASQVLAEIRLHDPDYVLPESEVNEWGDDLFWSGHRDDALGIFQLNTSMYPMSVDAAFSLADAYYGAGRRGPAIEAFERTIAIDSTNAEAREKLRILRSSAD